MTTYKIVSYLDNCGQLNNHLQFNYTPKRVQVTSQMMMNNFFLHFVSVKLRNSRVVIKHVWVFV